MATKASDTVTRFYVDVEPICIWEREEECDTLVLHIQDFEKDQIKVHINDAGILTISGERPMDDTKNTKWSRFRKQIRISKTCKENEIRAKYVGGAVRIIMPKKITSAAKQDHPTLVPEQYDEDEEEPKLETTKLDNAANERTTIGPTDFVSMLKINRKAAVNVAMAVAVAAALGAYVTYKYMS
ncbi:hypothetical protein L1049_009068 [Liquidambar formosana]|uniref:SHSP domain-containing protein n=1 Tax=Liquidambar formosana TaxID=63359 RepID=A0AAP0X2P3_LIQFO